MVNWVVKLVDRLVNTAVILFSALILFISFYSLADNLWLYQNAQDESLLIYKPSLNATLSGDGLINDDHVAWLTLYGTSIDYPVMQGESNYTYLNMDPYGTFKLSGSIFLDYKNRPDFSDAYSLIYGHHMEYGAMFGALDKYLDQDYFDDYHAGTLITRDAVYDIELFAVSSADGADPIIFNPVGRTTEDIAAFLNENAITYTGYEAGRPILALSTCYGDTVNARLVVFGMLKRR